MIVNEGTIVDATIIHAPSSTKNKDRKRDPEMASTKKGNTWYFGMKAHVGADVKGPACACLVGRQAECSAGRRVHSVVTTPASVHDSQAMDDCLHGKEKVIYGDKAYADQTRKEQAEKNDVEWRVLRKARRGKRLNCACLCGARRQADNSFNKKSNRTRARVPACACCLTHADREHPFGIIKHLWGYRKVRYRGLAKNTAHLFTLFALANIYMARQELATP